jgi:hypothetical protein
MVAGAGAAADKGAAVVPDALRGLWRREEIFTPDGYRDTTTLVIWLQTQRFYADIRIPADRPKRFGAPGFGDYADAELVALARMQGFAGVLTTKGDVCSWRRDLDYQPQAATPDEARFEIEGDRMGEFGIHADYTEIWRRAAGTAEFLVALRREGLPGGLLVIAGDHFIQADGRAAPLPPGESLAHIVGDDLAAGRRDLAEARLSFRIAYGRVSGGTTPWEITLSTLPWLEGTSLFAGQVATFDVAARALRPGVGPLWRIEDSSAPLETLARRVAGV